MDIVKRSLDLVVSVTAFVVLSPLFMLCALAIYFNMGSPVLFIQRRPGKNGEIFKIFKFRTMSNQKLTDEKEDLRLTSLGIFLRKYSLDELPQLINVIKGDLSLVGPRPLLEEYLPLYDSTQSKRHFVKPGITGWAQVNGRNAISWEEKFELDVWYVNNRTLLLDFRIIILTFIKVFKGSDVNASNSLSMEKFKGSIK